MNQLTDLEVIASTVRVRRNGIFRKEYLAIRTCIAFVYMMVGLARPVQAHQTQQARQSNPVVTGVAMPSSSPTRSSFVPVAPTPQIDFSPSKPLTPTEIARRAFPSVVLLSMQDAHGQPLSLGSGFFIDKDVIATNFHVIDGAAAGYAKVIGQSAKLNVKGTISVDALHDLALLQVDSSPATDLLVNAKVSVNVGDAVYAIGNPQGLEGTFSQGIISSLRMLGSDRLLQITAPISPGSSGGPVLDQSGSVIGVSFASIDKGQNLNFAIPADFLAALQRKKTEVHPLHHGSASESANDTTRSYRD